MLRAGFSFLLSFLLVYSAAAQQTGGAAFSNIRSKTIAVGAGDTLLIDTLSIVPGSLEIAGVGAQDFILLPERGLLLWKAKPVQDSVRLHYRAMPLLLVRRQSHKTAQRIDSSIGFQTYRRVSRDTSLFSQMNGLEYNGSYGRSIALGNNQDVVLNSAFNLQASGYILDSIKLEAALSDNTIPLQPEGNTQRLQEFDQLYIRLSKNKHSLQAGDYNLEDPPGYFLNFFKRVQGLYYQTESKLGARSTAMSGLSASVAKGQFARNIFQGGEGNQGPYRLRGNNGEQFFIVLANTERVYVDDVLQERGENRDYIIDYNTAEVRFMPRRLISKDSRIQVEFEYQDRNYLNSLLFGYNELRVNDKLSFRINAYSSQDARNQSYLQNLDGPRKQFLSTIGDSVQNALYPVIFEDSFAANKILYKMVDTVVGGILYDSVFVYSSSPDSARFNLQFAFVGPGRGDYVLSARPANGRVYDWVAPMADGGRRGDYAPVQLLITPKMQQVFTLTSDYRIDSAKRLNVEVAASNYDPNLFSSLDRQGHWGGAARIRYDEERFFGAKDSSGKRRLTLKNTASYEAVQDRFYAIAPYRNVEFFRDWNVPPTQGPGVVKPDEHLVNAGTALSDARNGTLGYQYSFYGRGTEYAGHRHIGSYRIDRDRFSVGAQMNDLRAVDTFQTSHFRRPSLFAELRFPKASGLAIGANSFLEDNAIRAKSETTALLPSAFSFDVSSLYLRTSDGPERVNFTYTIRRDRLPRGDEFLLQSHSDNYSLQTSLARWRDHRIALTATYRKLTIHDTTFNNQKGEETVLGRFEYSGSVLKGAITASTLYDFGSGQEQKRAYTYIEVPAGQGQFFWNDYNKNGLQEANEFEIAIYPDQKRFVRIFTPTNEYVRAAYASLNQSLTLEPSAFLGQRPKSWGARFLGRFSDQASLQVSNRVVSGPGLDAYNPLVSALDDSRVLALSRSIANTFFFNRSHAAWGADWNYTYASNKQLLTYGVEGGSQAQHLGKLRWNITRAININLQARTGSRGYASALADGRSYRVSNHAAEPSATLLYRSVFRLTVQARYEERHNEAAYGGERASIQGGNFEVRYSQPATGVLQLRGTYAQISYNGNPASSVGFAMLDALQPGANFLWYAAWDRRVGKGIEVSLEYEGRKPGLGSVINTGRMTVRAVL